MRVQYFILIIIIILGFLIPTNIAFSSESDVAEIVVTKQEEMC